MAKKNYDFWGWATRNDLKCSDGRTIRHNAFKDCDGLTVPLVWNHQHNDPDNILGHALLKNTDEGVKAYGFFNDLPKSQRIKEILQHGDIASLSIFANGLKQTADGDVLHGVIREVSLVLAGANPGASIEYVMAHSADEDVEAVGAEIYTGESLYLEHSEDSDVVEIVDDPEEKSTEEEENKEEESSEEEKKENQEEKEEISHADNQDGLKAELAAKQEGEDKEVADKKEEKTVQDVLDSMTPEQRKVTEYLVGEALASAGAEKDEEEDEEMKHNAFDNEEVIEHDGMKEEVIEALKDAKRYGSVKESFLAHGLNNEEVLVHSINHLDYLAPEWKNVHGNDVPFITTTPNGWVDIINNGVHKTPFAKIKMMFADLTPNEARAKGYVKGTQKIEEVFTLLRREVDATTIYKKQSFDRDDQIDITDIDMVAWIKKEMRMKLDEERARAYIFGDGRSSTDNDKINEKKIIPVVNDTEQNLYAMAYTVTPGTDETLEHAVVNKMVKALDDYQGSGNITAFVRSDIVSDIMLMEDKIGQRLYKGLTEVASAMGVDRVVKVPASVMPADVYAVALDLRDYNVGMNKAGEVSLFDDFDIDYNKMKYLIETRCSGALVMPHSAVVLKRGE